MRTCKIIDTCTLINLFCEDGPDVSSFLSNYEVVITDEIVSEYTCKHPRKIPEYITVVKLEENDRTVMKDLELLMPMIGSGERSAYAAMIRMSKKYKRIALLTDDKKATKKLQGYLQDDKLFAADAQVVWGNTDDLINKLNSEQTSEADPAEV